MHRTPRRLVRHGAVAGTAVSLIVALAACSSGGGTSGAAGSDRVAATLTIYSGQHPDLVTALGAAFTKKTGIKVAIRSGEDADLVGQIQEEGKATRADIFLSEEPGPEDRLAGQGLLTQVPAADYDKVDSRLVPQSHDWLPYAARSRVIYYNPKKISKSQLPHSILDLSRPKWKGTFAYAPSGAFVGTVSYLINTIGKEKTVAWLKGIKANGINEQSNGKVRDTVEAGQHEFGISNHYYWWVLAQTKGGPDKLTSKVYFFDHPDAGSLIMASGAGILKTSKHQEEAQKFLAWLADSTGGQAIVAGSDPSVSEAQFPVGKGVNSTIAGLPPLSSLHAPKADQSIFGDTNAATQLLEQVGIS